MNYHDKYFNNKNFTISDIITNNRNPSTDEEFVERKYFVIALGEGTIPKLNHTLENYLRVSVGDSVFIFKTYNGEQILDTRTFENPFSGGYLLPVWNIECRD